MPLMQPARCAWHRAVTALPPGPASCAIDASGPTLEKRAWGHRLVLARAGMASETNDVPCQHGKQRMGRLKGEDSGLLACLLLFISSGLPISLIVGEIFSVSLLSEFIPPLLDCFYARDRVLLRPRHCPWRSSLCPRGARNRAIKRRPGRVLGVIIPHLSFPFLSFP